MKKKLDKSEIIKRQSDFRALIGQGKRLSSKHITLYFTESSALKYGFAVSRKVGNAVKRNKAKRKIKEILWLKRELLPENIKIVIFAKSGCERIEFRELESEYVKLINQIKS